MFDLPYECKSTAFTGVSVPRDVNIADFTASLKNTTQIIWCCSISKVIDLKTHILPKLIQISQKIFTNPTIFDKFQYFIEILPIKNDRKNEKKRKKFGEKNAHNVDFRRHC